MLGMWRCGGSSSGGGDDGTLPARMFTGKGVSTIGDYRPDAVWGSVAKNWLAKSLRNSASGLLRAPSESRRA